MSPRKKPDNTVTPPPTEGPFASNNGAVAEFTPAETDGQRNLTPADVVPFGDTEADVMEDAQAEGQDNSEILPSLDVPQPSSTTRVTVAVLEEDWSRLMALLTNVENARGEYTDAKEEASRAKKSLETAQEALERALDRMRAGKEADQEPRLPFDAPAGIPEPSLDGLPYDGIHQSDVTQEINDEYRAESFGAVQTLTPEETRRQQVLATSAWLIERGWKHCDPAHCERYSDDDLDKLLAWARGDTDIPEVAGLTTTEA